MIDLLSSIPTFHEALKVSIRESKKMEKQFSCELKIDASQWTRIMNGIINFPMDKIFLFQDISGNTIPLEWLAYHSGYEVRIIPKTLEEKISKQYSEIKDLKREINFYKNMVYDLKSKDMFHIVK